MLTDSHFLTTGRFPSRDLADQEAVSRMERYLHTRIPSPQHAVVAGEHEATGVWLEDDGTLHLTCLKSLRCPDDYTVEAWCLRVSEVILGAQEAAAVRLLLGEGVSSHAGR
jgi:hypothetical protein